MMTRQWERALRVELMRVAMGALACALCAAMAHALLAGPVLQSPSGPTRFADIPVKLSGSLALEGSAPPAWAYRGWVASRVKEDARLGSMLASRPREARAAGSTGWAPRALEALAWLAGLICLERWGALCEWLRVGLVRLGMTSRAPAQKSSMSMRAARQGLALAVCATAMLALGLLNPAYDPQPIRLGPQAAALGLAWGPWAPGLARLGMLP